MPVEIDDQDRKRIYDIVHSDEHAFNALVALAELNPITDFCFQNMRYLDFGAADLRGFSFYGCDLSYSNLEYCIIDETTDLRETKRYFTRMPKGSTFVGSEPDDALKNRFVAFVGADNDTVSIVIRKLRVPLSKIEIHNASDVDAKWLLPILIRRAKESY